jgi:hypothetical protein
MPKIRSKRKISPHLTWIRRNERWFARIWIDNRYYHFGCFEVKEDTYKAYEEYLKKVEEIINVY